MEVVALGAVGATQMCRTGPLGDTSGVVPGTPTLYQMSLDPKCLSAVPFSLTLLLVFSGSWVVREPPNPFPPPPSLAPASPPHPALPCSPRAEFIHGPALSPPLVSPITWSGLSQSVALTT